MRGRWLSVLLIVSVLATGCAWAQAPGDRIPDRYIVQVREGVLPAGPAARHGLQPDVVYTLAVNGFAGFVPPGRLRALGNDPDVVSIVPDRIVTADGKPAKPQPPPPAQVVPEGVKRIGAAPGGLDLTGYGVGVAVVDSGIDFGHADLPVSPVAFFGAVFASAQDDAGHGTHVAGTIAALDNAQDVVGVAPGATLFAVKVLDSWGRGDESTVIAGLEWVADNAADMDPPIRVVNMSLGRSGTLDDSPLFRAAVQALVERNICVVVSAGNTPTREVRLMVPAGYPEVLAVASTTAKEGTAPRGTSPIAADAASSFTTDGAFNDTTGIGVTISAPGEDQENILRWGTLSAVGILSTKLGGGTTRMNGTSMAAPLLSGVAALMYQQSGSGTTPLTPEDIRRRVREGAESVGTAPLDSPTASYTFDDEREGVLNAPGALSAQ